MSSELISHLLSAPDSQLDAKVKPLIEAWSTPPAPLQVLAVLDQCVHGSLASGVVVTILQILYEDSLRVANTTNEDVIKLATWRQ